MAGKTTKIYKAVKACHDVILEGTMLCIDPSTGSKSSLPGYALYKKGVLVESGEIQVTLSDNRSKRLYEISRTIREEFPVPDILVIEYIPPVSYKGSSNSMNGIALMALQKAIGAIIASHPFEHILEVPASSWKTYKTEDYIKTDEWDSITIGLCAIGIAKQVRRGD